VFSHLVNKIGAQIVVRMVLGTLVVLALKLFRLELQRLFGPTLATFFGVVCCTQFHLIFYMSRTLPNTFALAMVLIGFALWLQERYTRMIFVFTFTAVVIRFEVFPFFPFLPSFLFSQHDKVVLLLAPMVLEALFKRRVKLFWVIWCGVVFGLLSLLVTVGLDSVIWGRLIWPEGSGLLFNVVENKSSLVGGSFVHQSSFFFKKK
jgi:alpha-1,6-mannosyltransferase